METKDKIIEIVCDKLGVEMNEVTLESSIVNDLGADSLDTVEIVMAIEQAFNISVGDDEFEGIKTVGDLIEKIEEKCGKK